MPDCILNCFSLSCLYANVTDQTRSTVCRALQQNISQLLDASSLAVVANTPMERLARTQSLFLYQTIRLFDGDITLRSQAEQDMPLLLAWTGDLCKIRENLGDLWGVDERVLREMPPSSWQVSLALIDTACSRFLYSNPILTRGLDLARRYGYSLSLCAARS
jgi:hypothetical protein